MANKSLRFDEIGYWSEVKLDIVKKYAKAYSTIIAKQQSITAHVYVDEAAPPWDASERAAVGGRHLGVPRHQQCRRQAVRLDEKRR